MQTNKQAEPARRLPSAQRQVVGWKTKVLLNFFQKIVGFQRAKPLVACRNERNALSWKRIFESLKTFCKRKSFQESIVCTNYPQKLSGGWFLTTETDFYFSVDTACWAISDRFSTDSRKISHWEVFLESVYRLSVKGVFLLQKPPLFQSKLWIEKFTRKGAWR